MGKDIMTANKVAVARNGRNLVFNQNWANKLNDNRFTTFRLADVLKFMPGSVLQVFLNKQRLGTVRVVTNRPIRLANVTEEFALKDTGYNLEAFKGIVSKMYGATAKAQGCTVNDLLFMQVELECIHREIQPEKKGEVA